MQRNMQYYRNRLQRLEHIRQDIAHRMDTSYLRDNISDFMSLEQKYAAIISAMNKIRMQMAHFRTSP